MKLLVQVDPEELLSGALCLRHFLRFARHLDPARLKAVAYLLFRRARVELRSGHG